MVLVDGGRGGQICGGKSHQNQKAQTMAEERSSTLLLPLGWYTLKRTCTDQNKLLVGICRADAHILTGILREFPFSHEA